MVSEIQDLAASRQQQDALLRLLDVTCELASHHSLDQILQTVTSGACEALGCERASLYLYDADRQEMYTRVATELEIEEIRSSIESGVTGWVARNREVANIRRPAVGSPMEPGFDKKTGFQTRNILAAPIIAPHEDRLIGVLQLLNKLDGTFGPFDEQMIRGVRRRTRPRPWSGPVWPKRPSVRTSCRRPSTWAAAFSRAFFPAICRRFPDTTWRPGGGPPSR